MHNLILGHSNAFKMQIREIVVSVVMPVWLPIFEEVDTSILRADTFLTI
jgi:hypothetical protein